MHHSTALLTFFLVLLVLLYTLVITQQNVSLLKKFIKFRTFRPCLLRVLYHVKLNFVEKHNTLNIQIIAYLLSSTGNKTILLGGLETLCQKQVKLKVVRLNATLQL